MSIATEIQRLQQAKIDIKSAIEEKGVTVGDGTIDTYAEKISEISGGGSGDYDQGYEDGKNSVVDIVRYLFDEPQFTSLNIFGTSEVVLNLDSIRNGGSLFNMFHIVNNNNIPNTTVEHLTINCPALVANIQQMLYSTTAFDDTLKRVTFNVDTENCNNATNAFAGLRALEIVDGKPLNCTSITAANRANMFAFCKALKEVRFVANSIKISISFNNCSSLSTDTIQSIIDGLADLTGQTSQTLTVHQDVRNKLTENQLTTISDKNWAISPAEATT